MPDNLPHCSQCVFLLSQELLAHHPQALCALGILHLSLQQASAGPQDEALPDTQAAFVKVTESVLYSLQASFQGSYHIT